MYFPKDCLGVADLQLLRRITFQVYRDLSQHCEVNGSDLLREVSNQMRNYGFRPRGVR